MQAIPGLSALLGQERFNYSSPTKEQLLTWIDKLTDTGRISSNLK